MDNRRVSLGKRMGTIGNVLLGIFIMCTGITANIPLPYFKYLFLVLSILLIVCAGIFLLIKKELLMFVKTNKIFVLFGLYLFFLVTIKHIIIYFDSETSLSLVTGYGEVVYVLFGLLFFYVFSKEKITLFLVSYVLTFTTAFILFGKNTLYDYGGVCRTIGAYENPNTLALYACVALYMSFILLNNKNKLRCLYVVTAGIAFACILITTSRAMYLAIAGSCVVFIFLILFAKRKSKIIWKNKVIYAILFVMTAICVVLLYYPKVENAIVDGTKGELAEILAQKEENNIEGSTSSGTDTQIGTEIFNRVLSDENLSEGASKKNNTRFGIWKEYLRHIDEYILWGNYEGNDSMFFPEYNRNYVPHNIFISVLYKYGIMGLLLFAFILLKPVYTILKERKIQINQYILFTCMCAFVIYGMLHEATSTGIFWSIIGMLHNCQKFDTSDKRLVKSGRIESGDI